MWSFPPFLFLMPEWQCHCWILGRIRSMCSSSMQAANLSHFCIWSLFQHPLLPNLFNQRYPSLTGWQASPSCLCLTHYSQNIRVSFDCKDTHSVSCQAVSPPASPPTPAWKIKAKQQPTTSMVSGFESILAWGTGTGPFCKTV